jgi:hypothetical protein
MKTLAWTLVPMLPFVALASAAGPAPQFDAARLKTGSFTYRDIVNGKPGNLSTSTIARQPDGTYRFTADIPGFDQSWETVATPGMSPVTTALRMRTRDGRRYVMTLNYAGSRVSGEADTAPSGDGRLSAMQAPVTGEIGSDTVDQRIDWATVMSTDAKPGQSFEFKVYDAKTGSSRVHCAVSDAGMMDTPEGKIAALRFTYTVYKAGGAETYVVYANAVIPRMMLREDLRGDLTITLVKAAP